jgi:serine/threonine-protein kinase
VDNAPSSWSPDGRHLAVVRDRDLWVLTVETGKVTAERLTDTADTEWMPEFSPDGRWLAYASDSTGRLEVYVRPYPGSGPVTPVSVSGGADPAWNPASRELFFTEPAPSDPLGQRMMAVQVDGTRVGTPRRLFEFRNNELQGHCGTARCYAVTPARDAFLMRKRAPAEPPAPVTHVELVQNWLEELKAKVPVK